MKIGNKIVVALTLTFSLFYNVGLYSQTHGWGHTNYRGHAWVENASRPFDITRGLNGRHLSIWASHGYYYDQEKLTWKWQRPNLFCTTEDLFTQTIVVPYLMPMLENAGANIFTPRERDWQRREYIIDNDTHATPFLTKDNNWVKTVARGFASHAGNYYDGENPFAAGTALINKSTKRKSAASCVSYQPNFEKEGRYAVYVSYQSLPESVEDAQYLVYHKGQLTELRVNQQMGGGTWVYLGTFNFDRGCNEFNRVVVTNHSRRKGIVTTDAVRFGGGMGNIERGGSTSQMPRCLEGARHYAQWAGAPYSIYSTRAGENDYADDINVRSLMTNWLSGGSIYNPSREGLNVPIELSLAVHSDAGYDRFGHSLVGSLAICTTDFNDGRLGNGASRMMSKDFASMLLDNVTSDLGRIYGTWAKRYLWDRNYSETRLPEAPSAILETLSHQNFPDMLYGQDPNFRFDIARSIYKTILRFVNEQHGQRYVIQPLPPVNFAVEFVSKNKVKLSWMPQRDELEPSAIPTEYCLYTSTGDADFDNGKKIKGTSTTIKLEPGTRYNFRITAINDGGESFPSETLSACHHEDDTKRILIVNAFNRLSAPAIVDNDSIQGFLLDEDMGVSYGLTAGWSGRQISFDRSRIGSESETGLGYSGNEMAGLFVMGNTFDYPTVHVEAIRQAGNYQVSSCSVGALLAGQVDMKAYDCVDIIMGLQRNTPHATRYFKTFTPQLQKLITEYSQHGGALLVSGSYLGSDMKEPGEQAFMQNVLKVMPDTTIAFTSPNNVNGLGLQFDVYSQPNDKHYSISSPDALLPIAEAICAMQFDDGRSAAVAYKGQRFSSFTMAFPFECIISESMRQKIMDGILNYLIK